MAEIKVRLLTDQEIWEERQREIANNIATALETQPENREIYELMQEMLRNVKVKSLTSFYKEHKDG